MALLTRFQRAIAAFRAPLPRQKQNSFPLPLIFRYSGNNQYVWNLLDYEAYAKEGFSQNAIIYGALKYKMDAIAQSPMRVYEGNPYEAELYEDFNHPLVQLALRPNFYMSSVEFMQYCVMYLNLHGNCYVYITGVNDGQPMGMYPLRPDRVRIVPDKKSETKTILGYAYFPDGASTESAIPILPQNMAHIKFPNPMDDFEGQGYGLSPLSAGAFTTDTDNLMTLFLANYFKNNGMQPGGIISLPYEADKEDIDKLRAQFTEQYGGAENWGKPVVVDNSGVFTSMTPSFKDMVLDQIDLRNIRRSTVVFGVPARLIGLDEANSTYNNISEAKEDFWQRTMYAELLLFEEEFRHKLRYEDSDLFIRYDLSGIPAFAEDTTSQVQNYISLVGNFVPPNDAARVAGLKLPDIEGGDIPYMPVGLVPVKDVLNPPKPEANPMLPAGNTEDTQGDDGDMGDVPTPEDEAEKQKSGQAAMLLADGTPIAVPPLDGAAYGGIHDGIDDGADIVHYSRGELWDTIHEKIKLWDFDTKQQLASNQDQIAADAETEWQKEIKRLFKRQQKHILSVYTRYKTLAKKGRKNIDLMEFENEIRHYLFTQSLTEWDEGITPLITELSVRTRTDWGQAFGLDTTTNEFGVLYLSRESIEGEAWFAGYTLRFARDINTTTSEGIHAVIRDGLAEGYGTDKIGKVIEQLFQQYMNGNTSPEDWAFMQERMPAYRTEMIARTETHGAMSNSNHAFFRRVGVVKKEWWATADARTRESHLAAWQKYSEGGSIGAIDIDDKFNVGGAQMLHPGDKSAPLREFINCRCVELPVYPEDE